MSCSIDRYTRFTSTPNVQSVQDYYPFGMHMPGRSYVSVEGHRYGFNSHENTPEINNRSGHCTAEYWEYNPAIVHRWNMDPLLVPWESPYAINRCNPIWFYDPDGAAPTRRIKTGQKKVGGSRFPGLKGILSNMGNGKGLANWFRQNFRGSRLTLGPPAGRYRNVGWRSTWGGGLVAGSVQEGGSESDRTFDFNVLSDLQAVFGTSRVTLTGIDVFGLSPNPGGNLRVSGGLSYNNHRFLNASNGLQNLTSRSDMNVLSNGNASPQLFWFKSGFMPGLNLLPTLFRNSALGQALDIDGFPTMSGAAYSLWAMNMFNHKPLLSGQVRRLQFKGSNYLGSTAGTINFSFNYKAKVWQPYAPGQTPFIHRVLWGR